MRYLLVLPLAVLALAGCETRSKSPKTSPEPSFSSTTVTYPAGAPRIASDFHSHIGVNGGRRKQIHLGIDIKGKVGQKILAAADGVVLEASTESCWGPTIAVDHGTGVDGKTIIALYGHVGDALVKAGDRIRRGQLIARLSDNQNDYHCIGGARHLHFQLGQEYRRKSDKGTNWGWGYYLKGGPKDMLNPHNYWADGPNRVTCFRKGQTFKPGTLTYPVPCL
ncbi:M23 family metallopeptidase [Coralliovum pocilloporae]|uniref:M23 family metallopeptidase n=1 Tax=Coralliovum pocilloporae TaxID=3066369 RepID=UPI003306FFEB